MKKILKLLFKIIIILAVIALGIGGTLLYSGYQVYKEAIEAKPIEQAISEVMNSEDYVPYEQLSDYFCDAVVAIEDHRFWFREGIDYIAIGRAFVVNMINGSISEGGSTITQQLAKNLYFNNNVDFKRKIAEIFFVDELEKRYTKEEILSLYVSIIYYGDGYYGINDAASGYYNKKPSELDLYESAMLAGLPQSPSIYQLSTGLEKAKQRQLQVLDAMVLYDFITLQQKEDALASYESGG